MKLFLSFFLVFSALNANPSINQVTYRLSGGRFGDNVLAYMHAKWVSYRYGIQLLYHDFPYAKELMLEEYEKKEPSFLKQKIFKQRGDIDTFISASESQTLYVIPYFPESFYELSVDSSFSYFKVDWGDSAFKAILKKMVSPKKEMEQPIFPPGRISVALHIRRGPGFDGGYDSLISTKPSFPLKFPSLPFYIDAIKRLFTVFHSAPMYIRIFTDDVNPLALLNQFKMEFRNYDILWSCRETGNHWSNHVLEDFFAMTKFDCAVHGESNLALCAGKIADYEIEIIPETFHWEGREPFIDSVVVQGENVKIVAAYKEAL